MQEGEEEQQGDRMEKRNASRPSSVPPKSSGADAKRNPTDNGTSSKFPRHNKRKDSAHPRPKYDQSSSRKPVPQKSKAFDKRPRTRGYNINDRQREEMTQEQRAEFEVGSALRPGPKKGNFNHLLNFTFAPRGDGENAGTGHRTGWTGRNKWSGRSKVRYNKEQFLQANCQFIVKTGVDYSVHVADPDRLVEWSLIEQVRILSSEVPSCPICLYPPNAAKITRCGHIYCWSCILHYLSLGEKTWRKCPICYEAVHQKDLKSVFAMETVGYKVGDEITMRLMKRQKGTTCAMPRSQWKASDGKISELTEKERGFYAKLLVASPEHVQSIISKERAELEQQLADEEENTLESTYIQEAIEQLKQREKELKQNQETQEEIAPLVEALEESEKSNQTEAVVEHLPTAPFKGTVAYVSAFDDEVVVAEEGDTEVSPSKDPATDEPQPPATDEPVDTAANSEVDAGLPLEEAVEELTMPEQDDSDSSPKEISPSQASKTNTDAFYFYQDAEGQHIYLHSLNARCLLKEYGCWENCPDTITATVRELEGISMTTELRRRLRYLNHLPLTCEFRVAELALKPPVVSAETLQLFAGDIEKRRRLRQRKSREDQRHSRMVQRVEDRKNGKYPDLRMSLSSTVHFPSYQNSVPPKESVTLSASSQDSLNSTPLNTPIGSPPASSLDPNAPEFQPSWASSPPISPGSAVSEDGQQSSALSFAQMLRAGKAKSMEGTPRSSWNKTDAAAPRGGHASRSNVDSEGSDNEDRVPVPTYQSSFGDAIQEALDRHEMTKDATVEVNMSGSGKKKKGGKKKQLLFTTSMTRFK